MTDQFANLIVFIILLLIITAIVFIFNSAYQGYFLNIFLSKIKNNSGNYSSINIVIMFVAILSILFLLYWAFKPKTTRRESQFRSKD
jgi:hypothetical protein